MKPPKPFKVKREQIAFVDIGDWLFEGKPAKPCVVIQTHVDLDGDKAGWFSIWLGEASEYLTWRRLNDKRVRRVLRGGKSGAPDRRSSKA